ncbi:MAG: putative molybdenum carrier protein [Verrucomicrobiae bacterium]|nr:putative molybdenum carrier protein [Verrucomicrobiae bacterium]
MPDKGKLKPISYRRAPGRAAPKRVATPLPLERIVSGGQTGVDRAALDVAMELGVPHGGWCPRGRLAEDGPISSAYRLQETPEPVYAQRTEWNVRDSDGTVIFSVAEELTGGSALTRQLAAALGKPCLHLAEQRDGRSALRKLRAFIRRHHIRTLNVAGPRLSTEPGAAAFARRVLTALLQR